MAKEMYFTDLQKVKGLRVECKNCGGAFMVPIKVVVGPDPQKAAENPKRCPFCQTSLGGGAGHVYQFLAHLVDLRNSPDFSFLIESEKE